MDIWRELYVPEDITAALSKANFTDPTPIQSRVLPSAIRDCADILGAAPTGSGKTLAYGVPLLIRVRDLQLAERKGTGAAYSSETVGSTDQSVISDLPEKPSGSIDTSLRKSKKRKKLSKSDLPRSVYTNLALVEELDEETGAVRCLHSLLGDQYTEMLDFKVSCEAGATDRSQSSCRSHCHRVFGLVLLPTRELALQVCQHLRLLSEFMEPRPRIEAIVGGISIQKQNRLLSYHPEILVATPGRLWHFIQREEPHVLTVRNANILVVDEADKLIEANHFEELRQLFSWLNEFLMDNQSAKDAIASPQPLGPSVTKRRQTLVFSATLTFVHHGAMKPGVGAKHRKRSVSGKDTMTKSLKLASLRQLLGLNPRAKVYDLSTVAQPNGVVDASCVSAPLTPTGLQEMRLLCPDQPSKDVRLFWFLAFRRHLPATGQPTAGINQRSLIFVNSKTGVRRLAGVLRQLVMANAFSVSGKHFGAQRINLLHADMIQKQRLRALERFQSDPNGILLASDVAARGLDLATTMDSTDSAKSGVAWVVHFEVPHTAELYIHRSGRTARAHRTGNSVLFICPNEMPLWRRLAFSLKRTDFDLPDLPVEPSHFQLVACERIVHLAKQLDLAEHSVKRRAANEVWFTRAARDADIELDSDLEPNKEDNSVLNAVLSQARKLALKLNLEHHLEKLKVGKQVERSQIRRQFNKLRSNLIQLVTECQKSLKNKLSNTPNIPVHTTSKAIRSQLKRISKNSKKRSIIPCT